MNKKLFLYIVLVLSIFLLIGCSSEAVNSHVLDADNTSTPETSGSYAVYQPYQGDMTDEEFKDKLYTTLDVLEARLTGRGFTDAKVVILGSGNIRVEVPGKDEEVSAVFAAICKPVKLEIKDINGNTRITGDLVESATAMVLMETGEPVVEVHLNAEGADVFGKMSAEAYENMDSTLDIVIDGQTISSPAVKDGPIYGGILIISGGGSGFTKEEAMELAINIQSGVLPLQLHQIE